MRLWCTKAASKINDTINLLENFKVGVIGNGELSFKIGIIGNLQDKWMSINI